MAKSEAPSACNQCVLGIVCVVIFSGPFAAWQGYLKVEKVKWMHSQPAVCSDHYELETHVAAQTYDCSELDADCRRCQACYHGRANSSKDHCGACWPRADLASCDSYCKVENVTANPLGVTMYVRGRTALPELDASLNADLNSNEPRKFHIAVYPCLDTGATPGPKGDGSVRTGTCSRNTDGVYGLPPTNPATLETDLRKSRDLRQSQDAPQSNVWFPDEPRCEEPASCHLCCKLDPEKFVLRTARGYKDTLRSYGWNERRYNAVPKPYPYPCFYVPWDGIHNDVVAFPFDPGEDPVPALVVCVVVFTLWSTGCFCIWRFVVLSCADGKYPGCAFIAICCLICGCGPRWCKDPHVCGRGGLMHDVCRRPIQALQHGLARLRCATTGAAAAAAAAVRRWAAPAPAPPREPEPSWTEVGVPVA